MKQRAFRRLATVRWGRPRFGVRLQYLSGDRGDAAGGGGRFGAVGSRSNRGGGYRGKRGREKRDGADGEIRYAGGQ